VQEDIRKKMQYIIQDQTLMSLTFLHSDIKLTAS